MVNGAASLETATGAAVTGLHAAGLEVWRCVVCAFLVALDFSDSVP